MQCFEELRAHRIAFPGAFALENLVFIVYLLIVAVSIARFSALQPIKVFNYSAFLLRARGNFILWIWSHDIHVRLKL